MARQLSFDLIRRTALGREDFIRSPGNAAALGMVDRWRDWPSGKLAICGAAASGKTHLVHVWAADVDAVVVQAAQLGRLDVPTLVSAGRIAVEDVPAIAGDRRAEAALFHLHNLALAEGGRLLVTGRTPPAHWPLTLPDLKSRLSAATLVTLEAPDDDLLVALLEKHLADRQITLPAAVGTYLAHRMERSADAARALAGRINRLSLARRQPVTIPLARAALADPAGGAAATAAQDSRAADDDGGDPGL